MKIRIIDGDQIIDRDMTDDELADYQTVVDAFNNSQNELTQKQQLRAAAIAKLGLTADEIAALFG